LSVAEFKKEKETRLDADVSLHDTKEVRVSFCILEHFNECRTYILKDCHVPRLNVPYLPAIGVELGDVAYSLLILHIYVRI
jgi:hypothetical protein